MPNPWVMHVKQYAMENNKSYGCAISDPECKATYKRPIKIKNKTKKQLREESELEENKKIKQKQKQQETDALIKYYEQEREKELNNSNFLSYWLDIKIVKKERGVLPEEMEYFNIMFNLIDNYFKTGEVLKKLNEVNFTLKAQEYIYNWLEKKNNAGNSAELSDFIKLVVFPRLKKDNPNIDNITLILESINISVELKKTIDDDGETQFNSYRIVKAFMDHKISHVYAELMKKIKGLRDIWVDYVGYKEGGYVKKKLK
jgi:hypothetical protein